MKVLFVSRRTLLSSPGGDTIQMQQTAAYLRRLGHQVDITVDHDPRLEGYDILHGFNLMDPQDIALTFIRARKRGMPTVLSTIYGLYEEFERKARKGPLGWIARTFGIHTTNYIKIAGRAALRRDLHAGVRTMIVRGYKNLQTELCRATNVFLPNSFSEQQRVATDFGIRPERFLIVPNACDLELFDPSRVVIKPEHEKARDSVLCVARIDRRKCQLDLIRACKTLPYRLVLIGHVGGHSKSYLQECLRERSDNVLWLGSVPHEELPGYYAAAKVHALVSWMETPGLASIEAAAMGCNIVATRKGDPYDYFGEYAYYCEPGDIGSIAEAISRAFTSPCNPSLADHVRANFTWEAAAKRTEEGYVLASRIRADDA